LIRAFGGCRADTCLSPIHSTLRDWNKNVMASKRLAFPGPGDVDGADVLIDRQRAGRRYWCSLTVVARSASDEAISFLRCGDMDCFACARNDENKALEVVLRQHQFGKSGPPVSVIGQGTWYIDRGNRESAVAALRRGIDLGMTHIDTAEMYGDAELVVADAITGRRDDIFLVSKVLPSNASRRGTITACERSLARLKTDRLDCYLLHWRGSYPLAETVAAFEQLVSAGKIRSWGVSNFDAGDLDEMLAVAGEGKIACNQVLYHLQERAIEHAVIPWCTQHGTAVVAYSPFGHNDFPSPRSKAGEVLQTIAKAHGASPRQVALSFLTREPSVIAIPKASTPEHAADNAAAGELVLRSDEVAALDKAFPRGPKPRSLPML
jgi:diketogulonate reductase-like aldo/keto reductase